MVCAPSIATRANDIDARVATRATRLNKVVMSNQYSFYNRYQKELRTGFEVLMGALFLLTVSGMLPCGQSTRTTWSTNFLCFKTTVIVTAAIREPSS
jgi:hypothetical protein